jgi:hypothetical protein
LLARGRRVGLEGLTPFEGAGGAGVGAPAPPPWGAGGGGLFV